MSSKTLLFEEKLVNLSVPAQSLETATHSFTDQLNQLFQHTLSWRLNALKAGRTIVATHVDAVQEQDMEVDTQCLLSLSFGLDFVS